MSGTTPEAIARALRIVGRDPRARALLTRALRGLEATLPYENSVRDDITGPLVDALYADAGLVRKKLQSGLVLDFYPTSKITRDFILSRPTVPSHVWEPQTTRLLLHLSRNARHVVIGGAYFGDHALLVAQQIAAHGGQVHAFEPNRENVELLRHNAQINGLANLHAHGMGLWDRATTLKLIGEDALASSGEVPAGTEGAFETDTIDAYGRTLDGPIGLVMLDIEGGEMRALAGARGSLSLPAGSAPNVVFEIHSHYVDWSRGLHRTDIVEYMQGLGYEVFAVRDCWSNQDMGGHPVEIIPASETYLEGPPHGFNMLAVKDRALVRDPIFRLRHNVSPKYLFHKDPTLYHPIKD